MGSNPATGSGEGSDFPVYNVSWEDCQEFIESLNGLGMGTFRLPSEAEWEYACRAGTTTRFYFGNSLDCPDDCEDCEIDPPIILGGKDSERPTHQDLSLFEPRQIAPLFRFRTAYMWYCANNVTGASPVRQKFKNAFGLYDMSGNVYEWCQDFYHSDYVGAPTDGSAWESSGSSNRVFRGGVFLLGAGSCRSAFRSQLSPVVRTNLTGFRLARDP